MNWDEYFLQLANLVSQKSKDPSTKAGAVLVRPDKSIASTGYNGFARGMLDDPALYNNRDEKYSRVIHAEMNAIMFCRDVLPLTEYTLYTTIPCCERCTVHMIQVGVRRFVFGKPTPEQIERLNLNKSLRYFEEVSADYVIKDVR